MVRKNKMVSGKDVARAVRDIESDPASCRRHWAECAARAGEWLETVKQDPNASERQVKRAERDVEIASKKLAALSIGRKVTLLNNCNELDA